MAALSAAATTIGDLHPNPTTQRGSLDGRLNGGSGGGAHSSSTVGEGDDENGAAFFMHCSGLLKMVVDAAGKSSSGGRLPLALAALKQHAESLIEEATNGAKGLRRPPPFGDTSFPKPATTNEGGRIDPAVDSQVANAIGDAASQNQKGDNTTPHRTDDHEDGAPSNKATRGWTAPHYAEFLAAVLTFVDAELLPCTSSGASLSADGASKMRKLSRDLLQLVVVRASSMLSHRLPHLVELSVCRGFFMWYRQQCRRGAPTVVVLDDNAAADAIVAGSEEPLSESVLSLVKEEEDRLRQEYASPRTAPVQDFPHHPIMHALLTGVLEAERCLLRSIELLAQCCPPSSLSSSADEVASVRVVTKSCVDVTRSLRLLLSVLHHRLDKAVENYITEDGCLSRAVTEGNGAMESNGSVVVPESAVPSLAANISNVLGVDVGRLLVNFGFEVCRTTCGYLIQVASITGNRETLSAAVYRNKSEAKLAMFRMMDALTPDVATSLQTAAATSSQHAIQNAMRRRLLPTSLFSDFIAAIARHCGDENDGQLLCVKLLTDGLNLLCGVRQDAAASPSNGGAAENTPASLPSTAMTTPRSGLDASHGDLGRGASASLSPFGASTANNRLVASSELECFVRSARHRRAAVSGLLNALVSVHRPVLSAALATMELMMTETVCIEHAAQEIGFVYANSVIRLLESDNSSADVKLLLVHHFRAMLRLTIPRSATQPPIPLLLVLFRVYDVNRRLHQLHVVQQYVAALARIIRIAGPHEFVSVGQGSNPAVNDGAAGATSSGGAQAAAVPPGGESLPQVALATLVEVMEVLADCLPHGAIRVESLRDIALLREEKTEDQRVLDLINNTPVKGICKRFFIDKSTLEQHPQHSDAGDAGNADSDAAASAKEPSLEYSQVPQPPNAAVASKVAAIADFLLHTPALNPMSIGEFLSDPKFFPLQVCRCFMTSLDLKGRSITGALSEMLSVLQLPKEGQRIERLLEFFTHSYFQANSIGTAAAGSPPQGVVSGEEDSGASPRFEDRLFISPTSQHFPFATADACFIVVVATVMLNTDLHNPRVSSKMTREAFRSQLRGCNDGKDFPVGFADSIFDSIHKQPLSNIKGVGATSVSGGGHVSTVAPPAGAMDMLFFSASERKELMFGMERQRLVSETRELLSRRSCSEAALLHEFDDDDASGDRQSTVALAIAKDLFECLWPSLCVVFGVAASPMVTGALPANTRSAVPPQPDQHLLRICLRGLGSAFLTGTAFKAYKESDVTLSTILKIAQASHHRTVREGCLRCLLDVGAMEHAIYFTPFAWSSLMQAVVEVKKNPSSSLSTNAESVFGLLEVLVARAAAANFAAGNAYADAMRAALKAITANATALGGDGIALGAHLYVMRRMLVYTIVSSHSERTVVERRIAMPLFLSAFGRAPWYELLQAHGGSNECLQLLYEAHAELAAEVWTTVGPSLHNKSGEVALFLECFGVLAEGMKGIAPPPQDASALLPGGGGPPSQRSSPTPSSTKVTSMMRMYVIQSVKTICAATIVSTATAERSQDIVPLSIALQVWEILLRPLVMAMSDADSVASENCAVAVLALRHLIVCWCGNGSINAAGGATAHTQHQPPMVAATLLPYPHLDGLGYLLAHVAYVGSMCADVSSAHSCVSQFNTLVTTVLNAPQSAAGLATARSGSSLAGSIGRAATPTAPIGSTPSIRQPAATVVLTGMVTECEHPGGVPHAHTSDGVSVVALCVVERLCLLLRCDKQSVRQEVVDVLRHLPVLFGNHSVALHHFFDHMCHAVLEASLGHADPAHRTASTDPCLESFHIFRIDVPATMKRCSRTSFSATLPLLLHAVASDVLPALATMAYGTFALVWIERCLLPLTLSPRVQSHTLRVLALRALLQVVQTACDRDRRYQADGSSADQSPARSGGCFTTDAVSRLYAVVSFLLYSCTLFTRLDDQSTILEAAAPLTLTVPPQLDIHTTYDCQCQATLSELQWCEPSDIVRVATVPSSDDSVDPPSLRQHPTTRLALMDDKAHLQQLWSLLPLLVAPLPKVLQSLIPFLANEGTHLALVADGGDGSIASSPANVASNSRLADGTPRDVWSVPLSHHACTTRLLVMAANHACALHTVFIAAVQKGDQALRSLVNVSVLSMIGSSVTSSSGASVVPLLSGAPPEHSMHPHAVVRGVLTSLFQIEMDRHDGIDLPLPGSQLLHTHLVETVAFIAAVTEGAARLLQALSPGTPPSAAPSAATAVNHNILHLARTCCSGMMQELSVVLSNITTDMQASLVGCQAGVATDTRRKSSSNTVDHDVVGAARRRQTISLRSCVASETLFDGMVALLSALPMAAALVPSVKRFLVTFRALGPLPWSPHAAPDPIAHTISELIDAPQAPPLPLPDKAIEDGIVPVEDCVPLYEVEQCAAVVEGDAE